MVRVHGFCIDRWEATMVDAATAEPLSPYYPPEPRLLREVWQAWDVDRVQFGTEGARAMPIPEISEWERSHSFHARAISVPSAVPQAYVAYPVAKRACEAAGKRLCTEDEWVTACKGDKGAKFPYGDSFDRSRRGRGQAVLAANGRDADVREPLG
jgi:sulfatase modifying factor 1